MSDIIKALLNARSLKAAAKELTLEQLEESLAKLNKIVEDRRADEEADQVHCRALFRLLWQIK